MNRYIIRDYSMPEQVSPARLFDFEVTDDGEAFIVIKKENEKFSRRISLREAFRQAGINIDYTLY